MTELELLRWLLGQIVDALPADRDWLDPDLERMARAAMAGQRIAGRRVTPVIQLHGPPRRQAAVAPDRLLPPLETPPPGHDPYRID